MVLVHHRSRSYPFLYETGNNCTLLQKAKTMMQLNHPNQLRLFAFTFEPFGLVMEDHTMANLATFLKERPAMLVDQQQRIKFAYQFVSAVEYIHIKVSRNNTISLIHSYHVQLRVGHRQLRAASAQLSSSLTVKLNSISDLSTTPPSISPTDGCYIQHDDDGIDAAYMPPATIG